MPTSGTLSVTTSRLAEFRKIISHHSIGKRLHRFINEDLTEQNRFICDLKGLSRDTVPLSRQRAERIDSPGAPSQSTRRANTTPIVRDTQT
jgi:hypothetical protein